MTDDRWQRLDDVFHRALDLPADERDPFLVDAAGGDAAFEKELRRLLAAHDAAKSGFLDQPVLGAPAGSPPEDEPSVIGRLVGPYRILQEIGRGGMGTVYLAERDDAQYRKRLAVKLVKRGMDSDSVLRRFVAERQILASMDHPNIARLHDGGTAEDGRPYFVMELVEGRPIDEYARSNSLSIEARLQLFRQVCAAVSYAHQHLVIHRDLKPSNILVTNDGTAKLLDFGIARILDPQEPDTPSTVTVLGLMTPEFASPEQISGRHATTASDVYALGLVLYRLLTGSAPYHFENRSPDAMAHVIGNIEPIRPSATGPGTHRLRGDLDNIVLKALQKDPARRYASVEQFSEDIRRHLEGLPVIARPDTLGYRATKFVRRNRVAVTGAGIVLITLIGGIVATSWQARVARIEQARAERRFQEVRRLARTVLFDYYDLIENLPGATPVRERLVRDAMTYLEGLSREAGADTGLILELANAYERIGEVQGGTHFTNLGDTEGAVASTRKALELYQSRLALTPDDLVVRRDVAVAHVNLGKLLWEKGETDEALRLFTTAIAALEELVAEHPSSDEFHLNLAGSQDYLGLLLQDRGEIGASIEAFRAALRSYRARSDQGAELVRRSIATELEHLATALLSDGRFEEALATIREAIGNWTGIIRDFPDNAAHQRALGVASFFEGDILSKLGRREEALVPLGRYLETSERLAALDPASELYRSDQGYALMRMGDVLVEMDRADEALQNYGRALQLRLEVLAPDPINLWKRAAVIEAHAKRARTLATLGRQASSTDSGRQAFALMKDTEVEPRNALIRGFFAETYSDLGEACARLAADGRTTPSERPSLWREARDHYRRSADIWNDMQTLGIVSNIDAEKPARVAAELARCEAAIAGR